MTSASKLSEPTASSAEWAHTLTPALVLGFVAIIFLLIATLVVGDLNLRKVYAAGEAVQHSEAVKLTLQQPRPGLATRDSNPRSKALSARSAPAGGPRVC